MTIALSRREFLKVSTAVSGGARARVRLPGVVRSRRRCRPSTEVNAWIVIHPDDRVVIRIARSEMGQGTYTALAQLVAEELDCDWAKVSAEFASPNEHIRRNRIWGSMSTGGSMGVRSSQDYVRKAGASARAMLVEAAAARWKVPAAECTAANGVDQPWPDRPEASLRRGRRRRGQACAAEGSDAARSRRTGRSPASRCIASTSPTRCGASRCSASTSRCPGCCTRRSRSARCSAARSKGVDARAALAMRGVKKVVREESFVAVVADNWWRANEALKKVKIDWDAGGNGRVRQPSPSRRCCARGLPTPNLPQARKLGDVQAAIRRCGEGVEAEYQSPYLNHATHGAADLHRVVQARGFPGGVDLDAERRGLAGRRGGRRGPAAGEGRGAQDDAGRRLRPPRRAAGLRPAGRGDRQGDARRAGEDDVVARRGHAARLLSPGEHRADEGGPRCAGPGDRDAHADRLSVDPQGAASPERAQQGRHRLHGGALLQRHALRGAEPAGGLRDAQRPCAGRLLACAGPAECVLPRVLHRRTGGRGGQGPGRIPAGDAEAGRQEPPRARSRGQGGRLGVRRCRRACTAASRSSTASAATRPWWRRCR